MSDRGPKTAHSSHRWLAGTRPFSFGSVAAASSFLAPPSSSSKGVVVSFGTDVIEPVASVLMLPEELAGGDTDTPVVSPRLPEVAIVAGEVETALIRSTASDSTQFEVPLVGFRAMSSHIRCCS